MNKVESLKMTQLIEKKQDLERLLDLRNFEIESLKKKLVTADKLHQITSTMLQETQITNTNLHYKCQRLSIDYDDINTRLVNALVPESTVTEFIKRIFK